MSRKQTLTESPRSNKLAANAMVFWRDGSTRMEVVEVGLVGDTPYVVRVSERRERCSWIPINVLVFAESKDHARQRVFEHIKYVLQNQYNADHGLSDRATKIFDGIADGTMKIEVEPLEKNLIHKISWSGSSI